MTERTTIEDLRGAALTSNAENRHAARRRNRFWSVSARITRRPEFGAFVGMLAVFAFFAFATAGHGFFTSRGAAGWLNVAAELGIVAVPVALLMIAGELDLSVGSLIGATSVLIAVSSGYYGPADLAFPSLWRSRSAWLSVGSTGS